MGESGGGLLTGKWSHRASPILSLVADRMRVATFNVHHCEGLDGRVDVERIAALIVKTGAEVVALQELDRRLPRSGSIDQPVALEQASGMRVEFHATLQRRLGEYGIGIASRTGVGAVYEPLPRIGDEEPRGLLRGSHRGVEVIATHFSRDPAAKTAQIAALAETARRTTGPLLVLGDLNAEARLLGPLDAAALQRCAGAPTMPVRRPRRQIDHVLATGGASVIECWTLRTEASDHRPLVAEIQIE